MLADSLIHLILAFVLGGVCVGSATLAAKKFHSGIGGLIGGLPSISSVSFFFIGLNQSPEAAYQATTAFPLGMSFTFLFLLVYTTLSKKGFKIAITSALLVWFTLSGAEAYVHLRNLLVSISAVTAMFALSMYIYNVRLKLPYARGAYTRFSLVKFLEYTLLGGGVVAVAVYLSQVLGTTAGGIAAAVPAIFSMTLTFTYLSDGGMNLSRSMAKPLMITAMTVAFPYSVLVGLLYPTNGLYLGTFFAAVAAIPLAGLAYLLLHKKRV
jgi:uncharacterized membrane protein (GlpM family)